VLELLGLYYAIGLWFQYWLLCQPAYVAGIKEAQHPDRWQLIHAYLACLVMATIWPKHVWILLKAKLK